MLRFSGKWKAGLVLAATFFASIAHGAPRDVQIRGVNFDTAVIELYNFGMSAESLAGWRFCSHNTSLVRRYSGSSGLNGVTLAPGESLFVHYNNDANATNEINITTIGGAFAALERDAYGLQLYFAPVNFGNGNTIADHLQWSLNGIDNISADERSDEAEAGGVWVDQTQWISVAASTEQISLADTSGGVLHSPSYYILGALPNTASIPMLPLAFATGLFLLISLIVPYARRII